jgi:uncharacterized protein YqgC (DUF456 family)
MTILAGIFDSINWGAISDALLWTTIVLLIVVGFIGTFLPIIPGTTLIFAGMVAHYFCFGMEESGLAWQSLVVITLLYIITIVVDWVSGAVGAKWFGSSKWGVGGAILGGIVGLFFGLPGLIIGPILGVFLFEMLFAKKEVKDASNSTVGTVVGGVAGIAARVLLSLAMIAWYLTDVFVFN